ncbi:MAG: polyphosphate:AMP phosphotransferase [Negativicutes bacterium]|nr:polyphosphate:AMP phosphotransferase [Negativicutes bacterium]
MLDQIDLSRTVDKEEYRREIRRLGLRLAGLQRQARDLKIPLAIVFEGWNAAGKGTLLNKLLQWLDPRGFTVYNMKAPQEDEAMRPFLWRFWLKTPARGRISIFDRSWYRRVVTDRVERKVGERQSLKDYHDISVFERQLADDGCVVLKFFLHISKKEQGKRFRALEANKSTAWRVTAEDWRHHKEYDDYLRMYDAMLVHTNHHYAPWTVIEAQDTRYATLKVFRHLIDALEKQIAAVRQAAGRPAEKPHIDINDGSWRWESSMLERADLSLTMSRDEYRQQLKKYQKRLLEIEHEIYERRIPVVIVYEGWDAAGKGGNIKRLTENLDPRGYEVIPVSAPSREEFSHHYQWRFWRALPKAGHIAIFDRSWYGRVLVEPIEGFCTAGEWQRAYQEINEMEETWANFGTVIFKFWLHIDKEEQLRRFSERQANPDKQYKITEEDWRNRDKWDQYQHLVDEMLIRTSTPYAPWTVVESNCKLYARIKVLQNIVERMDRVLG